MTELEHHGGNRAVVPVAILVVVVLYGLTLVKGWPQRGTELVVQEAAEHQAAAAHDAAAGAQPPAHEKIESPPVWAVIPFVLLLAAIAVLPLIPATEHWWDSNINRFKMAAGLGALVLAYYAFLHNVPLEGHWPAHHLVEPTDGVAQWGLVKAILGNAILKEYIPFIVLLFSLFSISGGIRIEGDLQANPMTNASFMAIGGLLASLIGTTGAAMLLIRPLLETNRERKHVVHTVVFFIFVVCNCGGCLLPIGDPPLFLGYLEGVPFLWTLSLWKEWLFVVGLLLVIYLVLDQFIFYRRETLADIERDVERRHRLRFDGWRLNLVLLIGVVLAVALLDPAKPFPGTDWHPWMYLREIIQLALVAVSLWFGSPHARAMNHFNFHAIVEVAALFVGIFVCMQPALQILEVHGAELGIDTAPKFFWTTGALSSVLDNAPTYLVFFKTAQALPVKAGADIVAHVDHDMLAAISLGAVFMGSMTYIGNGPNFMVKAIAEKSGIKMPSFFGYMVYSCLILLPLFALTVWQFIE
jgi:Na+/H+ antiporter NhaD/arsenite permease-like protein